MGAGWCPPGMLGIGIGGSAEKAMLLAKEALMEPIDMAMSSSSAVLPIRSRSCASSIYDKVNALGIGAQGLGGLSTVLDVKILDYPTHAASQAGRHDPELRSDAARAFHARRSGRREARPARSRALARRALGAVADARRVDLDTLTPRRSRERGSRRDRLLLSRQDAHRPRRRAQAHRRSVRAAASRCRRASISRNRVIYYVGPVDPVRDEVVGPAGPTTATRMDKFTEMMLAKTGLIAMIGKAERGPVAIEAIRKHRAAYLMAVGGAAYLVSKAIKSSRVVAFADLGMEAIYEFDVADMPVTVAVDATGTSVHQTGPREWRQRIGKIPVTLA
mgnify:CR=1 FL=1